MLGHDRVQALVQGIVNLRKPFVAPLLTSRLLCDLTGLIQQLIRHIFVLLDFLEQMLGQLFGVHVLHLDFIICQERGQATTTALPTTASDSPKP